jgi:ipoprotein LpqH
VRTIEIGGEVSGATVVIDQHQTPVTATSVHIQNLSGFTGMWSPHDGSTANASLNGDTFTVSGTADGYKSDKPTEPATADFKIVASC